MKEKVEKFIKSGEKIGIAQMKSVQYDKLDVTARITYKDLVFILAAENEVFAAHHNRPEVK